MASEQAVASNPDANTLVVTLRDGTVAFRGKYDQEVNEPGFQGEAQGVLTFGQGFSRGDSTTFDVKDNGTEVTITFTDTQSGASAEFKGTGHIRPGTGTGTWLL